MASSQMMVIMLEPHFKTLHIMKSLVGCGNANWLAFEYDAKDVIPLLMVCFEWLNPNTIAFVTTTNDMELEFDENVFEMGALIKESF